MPARNATIVSRAARAKVPVVTTSPIAPRTEVNGGRSWIRPSRPTSSHTSAQTRSEVVIGKRRTMSGMPQP